MANIPLYLILSTALNCLLFSTANYVGTPNRTSNLQIVYRPVLEFKCEYTGEDDDGQFLDWYKDNEVIVSNKSGRYVVSNSAKLSVLAITLNETDQGVREWSLRTSKPGQEKPEKCQFGRIFLKPSPQRMETNRDMEIVDTDGGSLRRVQNELLTLKCILVPVPDIRVGGGRTRWQYSRDGVKYAPLPAGIRNSSSANEITIERVNKAYRGYYRCSRNGYSFTVLLRVKDPFAALWPFLGIVTTVIVLVIGIFIFEKRQKAAKKALIVEEEVVDNTKDPLVQSVTKSPDNEKSKTATIA